MERSSESDATATPAPDRPATYRLVIRAEIIPEPPPAPAHPRIDAHVLRIAASLIVAIAVVWAVIAWFAGNRETEDAKAVVTPAANVAPTPRVSEANPMPPAAPPTPPSAADPDLPPRVVNEVVPSVPQSALQTIQGTVRVTVRVTIDAQGQVTAVVPVDAGPSRYFERLSVEAARKWSFQPASIAEERTVVLRFEFTRNGASARTSDSRTSAG